MATTSQIMSENSQLEMLGHYINGQHVQDSVRSGEVYNPATGEVIKQVAFADAEQVDAAIIAADGQIWKPSWKYTKR